MAALPSWPGSGVSGKWPGPCLRSASDTPSMIVSSTPIFGIRMWAMAVPSGTGSIGGTVAGAAVVEVVDAGSGGAVVVVVAGASSSAERQEEHTSERQYPMRIPYAGF